MCNKTRLLRMVKQSNKETVNLCLWHIRMPEYFCLKYLTCSLCFWCIFTKDLYLWTLWKSKAWIKRCSIWSEVLFSFLQFMNAFPPIVFWCIPLYSTVLTVLWMYSGSFVEWPKYHDKLDASSKPSYTSCYYSLNYFACFFKMRASFPRCFKKIIFMQGNS